MIRASLFDLDHTLFQGNCSFLFGVYLFKKRLLPLHKMFYLSFCYFFHTMGWMETPTLHRISNQVFFVGTSISLLKEASEDFLNTSFDQMLNPVIVSCLETAKMQKQFVAIVSSAPDFLVQGIAARLGVEEWLATAYQTCDDGTIGSLIKCVQGEEKAQYVQKLYARTGIAPYEVAAYTDSHLDVPLLQAVGLPIVVNPTRQLGKISRQHGWQVIVS